MVLNDKNTRHKILVVCCNIGQKQSQGTLGVLKMKTSESNKLTNYIKALRYSSPSERIFIALYFSFTFYSTLLFIDKFWYDITLENKAINLWKPSKNPQLRGLGGPSNWLGLFFLSKFFAVKILLIKKKISKC